jgi:hypothetical protein
MRGYLLGVAHQLRSQFRLAIRALPSLKAIQGHEVSQQTCSAVRKARMDSSLAPGSSDSCAADPLSDSGLHVSAATSEESASS